LKWIEKDDLINFTCLISCLVSNKNEIAIAEVSESSLAENKEEPVFIMEVHVLCRVSVPACSKPLQMRNGAIQAPACLLWLMQSMYKKSRTSIYYSITHYAMHQNVNEFTKISILENHLEASL